MLRRLNMANTTKLEFKKAYGLTAIAKADSNHWIAIDTSEDVGGHNAGVRPMELLLMGLAGCTGMDVMSILDKMRVPYRDFRIEIEAERSDTHPKVYTKINLKYIVYGDVPEDKFVSAIDLSKTKYCSAMAMLSKAAEIDTSYEIVK